MIRHLNTILNDGIFKSNIAVKYYCSYCGNCIKESPDDKDVFSFQINDLKLKKAMEAIFNIDKTNFLKFCPRCRTDCYSNIHTRFKTLPKILVIEVNIAPGTLLYEDIFPQELNLKNYTEDLSTKVSTKYHLVALIDINSI